MVKWKSDISFCLDCLCYCNNIFVLLSFPRNKGLNNALHSCPAIPVLTQLIGKRVQDGDMAIAKEQKKMIGKYNRKKREWLSLNLGSHTLKNQSIILDALYSKYELKQQCLGFYCSTKLHVHVDEYIVGKNANEQSKYEWLSH